MNESDKPTTGSVEERTAPSAIAVEGKKLRGAIPYGVESRDMGGWTEIIEPGALRGAKLDDLVATVDHAGVPVGRYPTTLDLEDRSDALHWAVSLPESRSDVREAVERGDLRAGSWRMVVGRDRWEGDTRHVEEIAELRDVSVVTQPAYPSASVELRSNPTTEAEPQENNMETDTPTEAEAVEDREERSGGLTVEDRVAVAEQPVADRIIEEIRDVKVGEVRALSTTSASAVAPAELNTHLIDGLRASSIALRSGVAVVTTDRESISWPKLSADVAPAFYSEGGTITPGDPTFATLTAEPAKIAHIVQASNEVIDDSDPSVIQVLSDHLTTVIGLKLDHAIYEGGTALPGIAGMANTANIQTGGTVSVGGTASWTPIIEAVGKLREANAPEPYAVAGPASTFTELSLLTVAPSTYNEPLRRPDDILPPIYQSTQLTDLYVYSPSQVVVVVRQDATVEVDRSRLFNSDSSEIRGKIRADVLFPNPTAIVQVTASDS